MPDWGAIHEYSMYLSPVVAFGLLTGAVLLYRNQTLVRKHRVIAAALALYAIVLLVFFAQLTRGHGFIVTPISGWPIMSSLNMHMRYLYGFSLPVIVLALWCLQAVIRKNSVMTISVGGALLTLVCFVLAYGPMLSGQTTLLTLTVPYDAIKRQLLEHPNFLDLPVTEQLESGKLGHAGFVPLLFGGSDLHCHEPVFWGKQLYEKEPLRIGRVREATGGAFNMYNPACMMFPAENHCQPGSRVKESDLMNEKRFEDGQGTTWRLSPLQRATNWLSFLATATALFAVAPISVQLHSSRRR
jgi:hypothetical protein